jgi:hypothetical protein
MIGVITCGKVPGVACRDSFLVAQAYPNQVILSELEKGYGKDVITLRAIEKWTAAVERGRTELADLPRSGKPGDTGKVEAVRALIKGEEYLSLKKMAQMLCVHDDTIKRILRDDLNIHNMNSK